MLKVNVDRFQAVGNACIPRLQDPRARLPTEDQTELRSKLSCTNYIHGLTLSNHYRCSRDAKSLLP